MKQLKRFLSVGILLFVAVLLVSCKKDDDSKKPRIVGANTVEVEVGSTFDAKAGVTAVDDVDGDLTDKIVIDESNLNLDVIGSYTVKYTVTNSKKLSAEVNRKVNVVAEKVYADGEYNFKFSDTNLRNTFFSAAESYLLENVLGGVPLFVNSGMSIYSDRVQLPVNSYVPVMGWGSSFGNLTKDDAGLKFSDGTTGKAGEKTFRGAFSSNPTTFNHWISDDSVSSDATSLMIGSLYEFQFNNAKDGYVVAPSMAGAEPIPLGNDKYELDSGMYVSKKWEIPIRSGLNFKFPAEVTKYDSEITAQTFVDTFKYAIDQKWFRAIGGGSHFWAPTSTITGAKAYYDAAEGAKDWDSVGIKAEGNSLVLTFDNEMSEWNLKYWLSSNTMSPVPVEMVKDLGASYGTSPSTMAFTGPYYLDTYEPDKKLAYKKNDKFHNPSLYNYTGYNYTIIERAEIIFAEFEAGHLDVAGIPLTKYEQYKNNPGVKRSPGATTFRMNINALGNSANQAIQFPNSKWVPEAILANKDFRRALYFGVDRETLAYNVLKTSDPGMYLFSSAYLVDANTGVSVRDSEAGKLVGKQLFEDSYGYNRDAAIASFKAAVAQEVAKGTIKAGTAANPTNIELEIAIQADSTAQAQMAQFLKNSFESMFVDDVNHVKVTFTIEPVAFPDIYYTKQMTGDFDLGMGGISGSTLDASSFLEVFSSDDRGGFTLNWGIDTGLPEIPVTYVDPKTDQEITEYWSFDGIVMALNGDVTMRNGVEALDDAAIAEAEAAIDALPAVAELTLSNFEEKYDAIEAAYMLYASLGPRAQYQVTNSAKLFELIDKLDVLEEEAASIKLEADVLALELLELTLEDREAVLAMVKVYEGLNKDLVTEVTATKLGQAYLAIVELIVAADLPAEVTHESGKAIDAVKAEVANLGKLFELEVSTESKTALSEAQVSYVEAVIAKLPEEVTLEAAAALKAARAAFNELSEAQQALVSNKDALSAKEVELVELVISELPDGSTLTDRYEIAAARALFDALSKAQQGLVSNKAVLEAAELAVNVLIAEDDAMNWKYLIDGLPTVENVRESDLVVVEAARTAYNALTDAAKAVVEDKYAAQLAKLVELEDALDITVS